MIVVTSNQMNESVKKTIQLNKSGISHDNQVLDLYIILLHSFQTFYRESVLDIQDREFTFAERKSIHRCAALRWCSHECNHIINSIDFH